MEQWAIEKPYVSYASARRYARPLGRRLLRELRAKGFTRFKAPAPPSIPLSVETCERDAECRYLVAWVPDWSPSRHAGKIVARVDTLASA